MMSFNSLMADRCSAGDDEKRSKQQLLTGVNVVPQRKVITLSAREKIETAAQERMQLIH